MPFLEIKQMKRAWFAILICGLITGIVIAQEDQPCQPQRHARLPPITELTYHRARRQLLAAGWQPLQTISNNEAATDQNIRYGNGRLFWRRGYIEVEACSGTGVAACAFLWRDAYGNRLRVTTEGEELPRQRAYAIVTGFRFVCN